MPSHCAAFNCRNRSSKETKQFNITFHRFPRNEDRRKKWAQALQRQNPDGNLWEPGTYSYICSQHFTESDKDRTGCKVAIRANAVPKLFNFPSRLQIRDPTPRLTTNGKQAQGEDTSSTVVNTPGIDTEDHAYYISQENFYNPTITEIGMAKLPQKSTNHCSAINCRNNRFKTRDLSYFYFPRDPTRCQKWIQNSRRTDLMSKDVDYLHKNYVLCTDHFEMSQFMYTNKNRLIWKAVPTLFDIPNPLPSVFRKSLSPRTKQFKSLGPRKEYLTSESFSCKTAIKTEPGVEVDQNYTHTSDFLTVEIKTIKEENEVSPSSAFDYYDRTPEEIESNDQDKGSVIPPNQDVLQHQAAMPMQPPMIDQTTLMQNEDESFVLAPLEQTVIHGSERTIKVERRRKLIVDKVINISAEEIKSQLFDTTDIVTTLDSAPPTKQFMPWRENGGIEKLFALPGHNIKSKHISKFFQRHLNTKSVENQRIVLNEDAANDEKQLALNVNEEQELLGEPENQRNYSMQDQAAPDVTGQLVSTMKRQIEESISGTLTAQKSRLGLDESGIPQIPQLLDSQQHFMSLHPTSLHDSSQFLPRDPSMHDQSSFSQPELPNPPLQPSTATISPPPPQLQSVLDIIQLQHQLPLIGNRIEPKYANVVDSVHDCLCLQTKTIQVDYEDSSSSVFTHIDGRLQGIEQEHMDKESFSCQTAEPGVECIKTEPGVEVDQNYTHSSTSDFLTVEIKTIKEENEVSPSSTFDYNDGKPEEIERNDRDKDYNQELSKNIMDLAFSKRIDKFECNVDVSYYETKKTVETQLSEPTHQKAYECDVCHKCFSFKGNLKTHLIVHTKKKPFQCTICHKCFNQNSNLKTHMRKHTELPFECSVCFKCFHHQDNLAKHMHLHTNEKRFECHVCHKCFLVKTRLKEHMRVHTKEKLFKCDICHKYFSTKSSLKPHMRIHTKEKPFECIVCHKYFNQSGILKTHMRLHTDDKDFG